MADQTRLEFRGTIRGGVEKHHRMKIPGRDEIANAPADWPQALWPGSLNFSIVEFPPGFALDQSPKPGIWRLDDRVFPAAFVIDGRAITNNLLRTDGKPSDAQVWRAHLKLHTASMGAPFEAPIGIGSRDLLSIRVGAQVLKQPAPHDLTDFGLIVGDEVLIHCAVTKDFKIELAPSRRQAGAEKSDSWQSRALRTRRERPRGDRAANELDYFAPFYVPQGRRLPVTERLPHRASGCTGAGPRS